MDHLIHLWMAAAWLGAVALFAGLLIEGMRR